ncbi:MAG: hypothetical protein ACOWWO_02785 [Peptococcaceae bacterium]
MTGIVNAGFFANNGKRMSRAGGGTGKDDGRKTVKKPGESPDSPGFSVSEQEL